MGISQILKFPDAQKMVQVEECAKLLMKLYMQRTFVLDNLEDLNTMKKSTELPIT